MGEYVDDDGSPWVRCFTCEELGHYCGHGELGYDAGGILPAGMTVANTTLRPIVQLSPAQIQAYERAAELVDRWNARDKGAAQSP